MDFYQAVFAFCDTLLSYVAISYLFLSFSAQRRILFSPIHLVSFAICILSDMLAIPNILVVALLFVMALIISVPYKLKWYNCIFLSVFAVAISVISEMITGVAMMGIMGMSFDSTVKGATFFIGLILARFIGFVITYTIKLSKHKLFDKDFDKKWLIIAVLPVTTVLVCIVLLGYIQSGQTVVAHAYVFAVFVLLVLSNIFVFYLIDGMHEAISTKEKLLLAENLIKEQEKLYKQLYRNSSEVRKLRHNYKNFLLGIVAEAEQGNAERIKTAVSAELDGLSVVPSGIRSGNSAFDSLLNYKTAVASEHNITFEFEFLRMSEIRFSNIDLAVLVGNAIDHAIEATMKVNADERVITVSAAYNNSQLTVSIINPTDKLVDINDLSTDKADSADHGYGIVTMVQIAKRYGGDVVFDYRDGKFETIIYLNSPEIREIPAT